MKRKWVICLLAAAVTSALSGCGTELTEEESKIIADYAATTLLKYDMNYNARYDSDSLIPMESKQTGDTEPDSTITKPVRTADPKTIADAATQTEPAVLEYSALETGKLLGLDGIELSYIGMDTDYAYSKDNLILNAEKGYKLAILRFELSNVSGEAKVCNIIDQNIGFRLCFNKTDTIAAQTTILPEDLSAMDISLEPGEKKQAVLTCQIRDGYDESITSVDLLIHNRVESAVHLQGEK